MGRFWEGRFACREITHEGALLVCGMYVDLNPIRAGEARTPEEASHTSAWFRIQVRGKKGGKSGSAAPAADGWLAPLALEADHLGDVPSVTDRRASDKGLLSMSLDEYLQLLDWCGRQLCRGKWGTIPSELAPILERLGVAAEELPRALNGFPRCFRRLAGSAEQFATRAAQAGRRWLQGVRTAARVFR